MIAIAGASGFVGSRLLAALAGRGHDVRGLSRAPERLAAREGVEAVAADLLDAESLRGALDGAAALVYLAHGIGGDDFAEADRAAAGNAARAAEAAGVGRIVYLGGLGRGELSPHLESRREVGRILRGSDVATIELQASIVLGDGSASYELLRLVVETLPAAALPDWVRSRTQPIHVDDVVAYLCAALDRDAAGSEVFELGGPDVLTYLELMELYADVHELTRVFVPVPAPALPGVDLGRRALEAAAPERLALWLRLIESLKADSTVQDDGAERAFPGIRPRGVEAALRSVSR